MSTSSIPSIPVAEIQKYKTFPVVWGLGLTLFISYIAVLSPSLFSFHPILMSFGFLYLSSTAIQSIRLKKSATRHKIRVLFTKIHFWLQTGTWCLAVFGVVVIYINKERYDKPHFISTHSWYGLATMASYFVLYLSAVYSTFGKKKINWQWRQQLHRACGMLAYLCSGACILSVVLGGWGVYNLGLYGSYALASGLGVLYVFSIVEGVKNM